MEIDGTSWKIPGVFDDEVVDEDASVTDWSVGLLYYLLRRRVWLLLCQTDKSERVAT